jgi:uroporphyrinogen III methyltransferase/synthase
VVSGHDVDATDWAAFRHIPTLVVLMAGRSLGLLVGKLLQQGWAPETPVAVIRAAGTPEQREWWAELGGVVEATAGEPELSPCVTVVGQVARRPVQEPSG